MFTRVVDYTAEYTVLRRRIYSLRREGESSLQRMRGKAQTACFPVVDSPVLICVISLI